MDGSFSIVRTLRTLGTLRSLRITPRWSSLLRAFSSMSGSAIERSRERQRRVRLPPQGIA